MADNTDPVVESFLRHTSSAAIVTRSRAGAIRLGWDVVRIRTMLFNAANVRLIRSLAPTTINGAEYLLLSTGSSPSIEFRKHIDDQHDHQVSLDALTHGELVLMLAPMASKELTEAANLARLYKRLVYVHPEPCFSGRVPDGSIVTVNCTKPAIDTRIISAINQSKRVQGGQIIAFQITARLGGTVVRSHLTGPICIRCNTAIEGVALSAVKDFINRKETVEIPLGEAA